MLTEKKLTETAIEKNKTPTLSFIKDEPDDVSASDLGLRTYLTTILLRLFRKARLF